MRSKSILVKQSEARQKLGNLLDKEGKTEEDRATMQGLKTELQNLESELQAALLLEDEDDKKAKEVDPQGQTNEDKELSLLRANASVGRIINGVLNGHNIDGQERELQQAEGVKSNEIPLSLFVRETQGQPPIQGLNIQSIVPHIFADSLAGSLNIEMPSAASGTFSIPRLKSNVGVSMKAKGGDTEGMPATFDVVSTKPKRLSGRISFTLEDLAEVGIPSFESSVRMNLQQVMSQAFDNQILTGDGQGVNISGLFNQLTEATAATEILTFASVAESLAGQVDGIFSMMLADLRLVVRPEVYAKLASTFQVPQDPTKGGGRSIMTAADWLGDKLMGFSAHSRLPQGSSNVYKSLVVKNKVSPAACVPIWSNGITIQDMYTDSGKGINHFTVHMLLGDVLLKHPEAYTELSLKVS